jgi:hypothetical protein
MDNFQQLKPLSSQITPQLFLQMLSATQAITYWLLKIVICRYSRLAKTEQF